MSDIIWGVIIIGIGLAFGSSIFMGDFSLLSILFDGLGLFFIGKGVYGLVQKRSDA